MTSKETKLMSLDELDDLFKPIAEIDFDSLHPQLLEHLEEQLKLLTDLVQLRTDRQQV